MGLVQPHANPAPKAEIKLFYVPFLLSHSSFCTFIYFPIVFVRLIPLHTFYTCQISLLYSAIVRSDEKNPAFAMFTIIFFAHVIRSS